MEPLEAAHSKEKKYALKKGEITFPHLLRSSLPPLSKTLDLPTVTDTRRDVNKRKAICGRQLSYDWRPSCTEWLSSPPLTNHKRLIMLQKKRRGESEKRAWVFMQLQHTNLPHKINEHGSNEIPYLNQFVRLSHIKSKQFHAVNSQSSARRSTRPMRGYDCFPCPHTMHNSR